MNIPEFKTRITNPKLLRTVDNLNTLQVNIGRLCNLRCKHCHIQAGPDRKEIMTLDTMKHVLRILRSWNFNVLDITGGAPEMNPNFHWFVSEAVKSIAHVIVRSNLVILDKEDYKYLPEFFAENKIEIIASLPFYSKINCDRQRGTGVFDEIIKMLKRLNSLGYGKDERLILNLVYNPNGAFLPPNQTELENEYKKRLFSEYGVIFNHLFMITNNPVGRFENFLKQTGNFENYMQRLNNAFNPSALEKMMCRFQISVGWDGMLYDCDFNQAIGLSIKEPNNISLLGDNPEGREILFGNHCYACTAGAGSSCGGTTV